MENRPLSGVLHRLRSDLAARETRGLTDAELLGRFASESDGAAFSALMQRHSGMVLGVCRRVLGHAQDAEDACQATFLVLARKARSIRKTESLGSWLHGVAYRVSLRLKSAATRRPQPNSCLRDPAGADTASVVSWQEVMQVLDEELDRLPATYRAPLVLCYLEGQTMDEGAKQLGWKLGAFRGRLERGREMLRKRLTRRGITLPAVLFSVGLSSSIASAAMSPTLSAATVKLATLIAAGKAATLGMVSPKVVALVEGMLLIKAKTAMTPVLFAALVVATGLGLSLAFSHPTGAEVPLQDASAVLKRSSTQPAKNDNLGTEKKPKDDKESLQGIWVVVSSGDKHSGFDRITFTQDRLHLHDGPGEGSVCKYSLDPTKMPKAINIHGAENRAGGETPVEPYQCIYKLDGNNLELAIGSTTKRPATFADAANEGTHVVLKRQRKTGPTSDPGQARADQSGDPLPPAALLRLGTVRFRHAGTIGSLVLSPDGRTLATHGSGTVRVWDAATGKPLHVFPHERLGGDFFAAQQLLTFSPDSRRLLGAGHEGKIVVWELPSGKKDEVVLPGQTHVYSVHFSPDGELLAVGSSDWSGKQGGVLVREQATGRTLYRIENRFTGVDSKNDRLLWHSTSCNYSLALFSPDGKTLAVHTSDTPQAVRLCDAKTGAERRRIDLGARLVQLAFSPDGRHIAATERDNAVRVYETATGRRLHAWTIKLTNPFENYTSVLAFSPDGSSLVAGATDNLIRQWDITTGREVRTFGGHRGYVTGLTFPQGGKTLFSASWDGTVRCWDMASGEERPVANGYTGGVRVAYSPDGTQFASLGGAHVHLSEASTGRRLNTLTGKATGGTSLAFSSDGRLLAAGGGLNVRLWDAKTGKLLREWDWPKGKDPHTCVDDLAFSPDGRTLATAVSRAYQILLWDVASGELLAQLHHTEVRSIAIAPDGRTLASVGCDDKTLRLWDLPSGKQRASFPVPDNPKVRGGPKGFLGQVVDVRMESVACSPDGQLLATGHLDGSIRLWDASTGRVVQAFAAQQTTTAHGLPADGLGTRSLAFSPDGLWLASGGDDGRVCLWEPLSGQEVLRLPGHQASVSKVAFAPDGRTLLSGGRDCTGLLWNLRPPQMSKDRGLDALWTSFTGEPGVAYRALWEMAESAKAAIPFLKQRLRAVPSIPEASTRALLADLDSESFQRRDSATKRLKELGRAAESALREALKGNPTAEQKRRIESLLAPLSAPAYEHPPDELRQLRAVAVLERIGTPDARELLENLGKGHASAPLTQQAKTALGRLSKQSTISP